MIGNTVTLVGNLTDAPSIRFLDNGSSVANFNLAVTERVFDKSSNEWKDGDTVFVRCGVWKSAGAENVAESLPKGSRVIVTGKLRQHNYTTDNGENRSVLNLEVEEIGVSLRFAVAKPVKATRAAQTPAPSSDPWSMPTSAAAGAERSS
ncbi:single-stranded DNA-binding protein [Catenulispora yoronensis]|uniref:Single-stranded DNA-binding protein n=1 Tax=Catenulispora yoronensis TaxID=450799 RepID=A0ABN2U928_9ACTN